MCSPSERKRRLRTIAFDSARPKDLEHPLEAKWLPLEIYTFEKSLDVKKCIGSINMDASFDVAKCISKQMHLEDVQDLGLVSLDKMDLESQYSDKDESVASNTVGIMFDDLTARNEEVHGAGIEICDDPLVEQKAAADSHPQSSSKVISTLENDIKRSQKDGNRNQIGNGRVQLNGGSSPGDLGAHWSDYYALNPRMPEITEMAPWVAKAYKRRRERRKKS